LQAASDLESFNITSWSYFLLLIIVRPFFIVMGKDLSMLIPNLPILRYPLPDGALPVFG